MIQNSTQPNITIGRQLDALASDLIGLFAAISEQSQELRQHRAKHRAPPAQTFLGKVTAVIKEHPVPAVAVALGLGVIAVRALRRAR